MALAAGAPARRIAAAAGSLSIVALFAWYVRFTPLVHDYVEWISADAVLSDYLAEIDALVRATPAGEWGLAGPVPLRVDSPSPATGPVVRGASILRTASLSAWTQLRFPDRHVRVVDNAEDAQQRPSGSVTVIVRKSVKIVLPRSGRGPVR